MRSVVLKSSCENEILRKQNFRFEQIADLKTQIPDPDINDISEFSQTKKLFYYTEEKHK